MAFSDEVSDNAGGAISHGACQRPERNQETHLGIAKHEVFFYERKNKHEYANIPVTRQMTERQQDQCFRSMHIRIVSIHTQPFCNVPMRAEYGRVPEADYPFDGLLPH
jgi:hypothetical protein